MRSSPLLVVLLFCLSPALSAQESVNYTRDIKPILKARCYACHGALKQKAKLRLDTGALMRKGGRHGPAILPGNAADSLLVERISDPNETRRMPPEGQPLTAHQIALLKGWIDLGARVPAADEPEPDPRRHWAFQRPVRPPLPRVQRTEWVRNPIDAFLAAAQEQRGLEPNPPADKPVLLRRVYLDLIGLPPTPEELHAFLADPATDAYEKVVDRLLSSAQYGERWGRHWMDVWRYSDWYGARGNNDNRNSYGQIWRWRDWIVRSLNEDRGYDWMTVQMLAADEVTPADDANLAATGFIVRNWFKWNYEVWKKDLVEHTGKAFLGLTLNCCLCHDHKYDPIAQEEYFRFRAFFEPLDIRQDRVPGEPDPGPFKDYVYGSTCPPMASGMVRVFDRFPKEPTFMFKLGDARNRFEGKPPVTPAVPACLGGDPIQVQPVALPPVAYYPGLKEFIRREELAPRRQAVKDKRAALIRCLEGLAFAHRELARCEADPVTPQNQTLLASARASVRMYKHLSQVMEAGLATAEAEVQALIARIAADDAKYKATAGSVEPLAGAASKAERFVVLCSAKQKLAEAEWSKPGPDNLKELAAAKAAVAAAEKALTVGSTAYTPLSPAYPAQSTGRRAALARWIASRNNPLTARVAVNHIWAWHFGRPLVETTFNFGRSGKPPSHPELLDWLAVEFMEQGWTMKHLHRLLVTSNAYRMRSQSGGIDNPNRVLDRDNRFLWRFPSSRMEAEVVRDSILYVAGQLDPHVGGPEIDQAQGLVSRRRSLYFAHHAETKMEFLELFDGANACECYVRTTSVLPQQALALANSELTLRQGRNLAQRLWQQVDHRSTTAEAKEAAFIESTFEQILSRSPSAQEKMLSLAFLKRQTALFQAVLAPGIDAAGRAREDFVQALFSHNDFITIR